MSNPSAEDLLGAALAMWPTGPAFGSPDGEAVSLDSRLAAFTRVLVSPFALVYARLWALAREATLSGIDDLLPEWEVEYGLPDNCVTGETSAAERLRALEAKVNSQQVSTPQDFITLAARYGFTITIEEPAIFECGFSVCGGEHVVGDPRQETYWIVRVSDLAIDFFTAGFSQCGLDPLFDIGDADRLMCVLRRVAPAWTTPILIAD
ncbi:putative phage tail protein [Rhizobium metallidurans]|uniref:Uncharacterized protein YmfQ (DUF2313 family) n=1 Tax=Rhizobium metallidurans TaxID=1265931 RepID=A0A7W6CYC3_9HYPH|nr:putative phage tail protein [Rhizobium metallidurans]MBB3965960.1 uncharacterized protein YmfQ (DUF2313 family) [Rhizobium metallidurans]